MIEALDPWWRLLPMFITETGLRWGEAMGLRVGDFALGYRSLTVRRVIVETAKAKTGNGTRFLVKDYPKGKLTREFGVRAEVRSAVAAYVAARGLGPDDFLFSMPDKTPPVEWYPPLTLEWTPMRTETWPHGLPVSRAFFRQSVWLPAIASTGLPVRRFHDLRACHISWMLAAGVPMVDVMKRVGHRMFTTTELYVEAMPDADDKAVDAFDNFLGGWA